MDYELIIYVISNILCYQELIKSLSPPVYIYDTHTHAPLCSVTSAWFLDLRIVKTIKRIGQFLCLRETNLLIGNLHWLHRADMGFMVMCMVTFSLLFQKIWVSWMLFVKSTSGYLLLLKGCKIMWMPMLSHRILPTIVTKWLR